MCYGLTCALQNTTATVSSLARGVWERDRTCISGGPVIIKGGGEAAVNKGAGQLFLCREKGAHKIMHAY